MPLSIFLEGASTMASNHTIIIPIGGMTCRNCAASVAKKLTAMPGITGVEVSVEKGQAAVTGENLDIPALRQAIEDLGFDAGDVS